MSKKALFRCPLCELCVQLPKRLHTKKVRCSNCRTALLVPFAESLHAETARRAFVDVVCTLCGKSQLVGQNGRAWCTWCNDWAALGPSNRPDVPAGAANALAALVIEDLNSLARSIAGCLNCPSALRNASAVIESLPGKAVVDSLTQANHEQSWSITVLSLASDCLRRVVHAVLADAEVSIEELDTAYPLVRSIAAYYAQVLEEYVQYADLAREQITQFLNDFNRDNGWFGGGPQSAAPMIGATLSATASIVCRDSSSFDAYEAIVENVMLAIVGADGINKAETQMLKSAREFHRTMRTFVDANLQLQRANDGDSQESSVLASPIRAGNGTRKGDQSLDARERQTPEDALRQASLELEQLIGLHGVKSEVRNLISFLNIQSERRKHGLRESSQALHFVFKGNPGTGKTTVARILGKVLYGFGILQTPNVVECDRSKLVGGFLGQTAIKTDEVIQSALDGVLFIDEAYTLAGDTAKYGHGDMYGDEAINQLVKRMEDERGRLVVIVAGYPAPMDKFLHTNPGLQSRFTRTIPFEDYTVRDLCCIFEKYCSDSEYRLTATARANAFVVFNAEYARRDERFGNARFVRNVYEQAVSRHSQRLTALGGCIDKTALATIDGADIPFEMAIGLDAKMLDLSQSLWEGECPGCGKIRKAGVTFLGQRVACKCGHKFVFPWWNLVADSVKHFHAQLNES